jgi:hypothetical protein
MANTLTLERVQTLLLTLIEALETVAQGKEYWMNGQRYIAEDMDKISDQIDKYTRLESQMLRSAAGRSSLSVRKPRFS